MPVVTFTLRRGRSTAEKALLSEAMMEALVAAGYDAADRFHRFLELDPGDLLVDARFPSYAEPRTERFMMVEVVISRGKPPRTAPVIAETAMGLFERRLGLAPQDVMFVFNEVSPDLPRYPVAKAAREAASA